jgi:hypothetical protein
VILQAESDVFEAEAKERLREARVKDLEELKRYQDELTSIYEQINEIERREDEARLEEEERTGLARVESIRRRAAQAIRFSAAERDRNVEDLRRERDLRVEQEVNEKRRAEITEAYNKRIEAENRRHEQEKARITRGEGRALESEDPTSSRSLFGDVFADEMSRTGSVLASLGALAGEVSGRWATTPGTSRPCSRARSGAWRRPSAAWSSSGC